MPNSNAIRFLRPLDAPPSRTGGCRNKPLCLKLRGDFRPRRVRSPTGLVSGFVFLPRLAGARKCHISLLYDNEAARHANSKAFLVGPIASRSAAERVPASR